MTKLIFLYIAVIFGPLSGSAVISLIDPFAETFTNNDLGLAALVITVYTIPFAVTQLFSGAIADATSKKNVLVIGLALYGVLTVCVGLSPTLEFLFLSRFFQGIFGAFQIPVIIGIIGESTEKRGQSFGLLAVFINIGLAMGPLVAGILESVASWRDFFYILGIAGFLTAIVIHFLFDYEEKQLFLSHSFKDKTSNTIKFLLRVMKNRQVQIFSISTTIAFTGMVNTYIYVTTFMKLNGYSQIDASIPVTIAGIVGMSVGFYSGKSVDKFGSKKILYFGLFIAALAEFLIIFILEADIFSIFVSMAFLMILIGLANVLLTASANTIATEIDPELRATVASYSGVLRFLGFALIPFFEPIYAMGFGMLMIFSIILIIIGFFLLIPLKLEIPEFYA